MTRRSDTGQREYDILIQMIPALLNSNASGGYMKIIVRIFSLSIFLSVSFLFLVTHINAQWRNGGGSVIVYEQRDGRGNSAVFDVGTFRNDRGEFGSLRNDAAYSVSVPRGYRVRFCENENRNGSGKCEEFGSGNHNLRYAGTASFIQVTRDGGGGWNDGGGFGGSDGRGIVTVFEDRDFNGRSQTFGIGRYLNAGGQLGSLRNDSASSVIVSRGYRVRLCENEGTSGRGEGRCEDYSGGQYNLRYDNSASYVEVIRDRDRWYNDTFGGGNDNWNNSRDRVVLFSDRNQRGRSEEFGVGTFRADRGEFGQLRDDDAASVFVPRGYRVRICENAGGFFGNGGGRCEDYGAGTYNLRYQGTASFIRVTRD